MPVNSRAKGAQGEREAAKLINELWGVTARRSQQYSGLAGDSDLAVNCNIHFEIKRVEKLNLENAYQQAVRDSAKKGTIPVVLHRKNRGSWLITLSPHDLIEVSQELTQAKQMAAVNKRLNELTGRENGEV